MKSPPKHYNHHFPTIPDFLLLQQSNQHGTVKFRSVKGIVSHLTDTKVQKISARGHLYHTKFNTPIRPSAGHCLIARELLGLEK